MGCASTKLADFDDPTTPTATPRESIVKPAVEAGSQCASASTASNVQEELAAHQERDYKGSMKPACESDRMCTLNTLAVLDTEPERRFDDITKLCTLIFNVRVRGGCFGWHAVHRTQMHCVIRTGEVVKTSPMPPCRQASLCHATWDEKVSTSIPLQVPICLVSLVDNDRQWLKSKAGLPPEVTQTDRESSFCAW